jgi:hypothetical protein
MLKTQSVTMANGGRFEGERFQNVEKNSKQNIVKWEIYNGKNIDTLFGRWTSYVGI